MDRALGQFWPRARSKIYEEPKKLVALGLARATPEEVGGTRTLAAQRVFGRLQRQDRSDHAEPDDASPAHSGMTGHYTVWT